MLSRSDVRNLCTFGMDRPSAVTLADGLLSCDFNHRVSYPHLQNDIPTFQTMSTERMNTVLWLGFPKRLLSALKGLCCLAQSQRAMQAPEIAERIGVSQSETSKVMQMLVWGGFVTSRRGSNGGVPACRDSRSDYYRRCRSLLPLEASGGAGSRL